MAAGSFGVTGQDATPWALVVAVHDCEPFSVRVTVCPLIGAPVTELVSVPVRFVDWPYVVVPR